MSSRLAASSLFTLRSLLAYRSISRPALEAFRDARLREMFRHAWERVPYYRRRFERHGLGPDDVRGVADLGALPITGKEDVQGLPAEDLTARGVDVGGLIAHRTSGSTGRPFVVRRTWFEERLLNAFRWRALREIGWRVTDREARVALARPVDPRNDRLPQRLLRGLGLCPLSVVDCRLPVQEIVRRLCALRPDVLGGFSGALWRVVLAASAAERRALRPRLLVTGGEVLTPSMRGEIEAALARPVHDFYGCHECNLVAWGCQETGDYHTCDDLLIVEVLRDGRPVAPGHRGEIVITSLHSFAMPIIRFRLGDVVTRGAERCACGHPFATLRAIEGRMQDYFPLPDGRLLHPYTLVITILDNAPWLGEYRLVQERTDRIVLRAVPRGTPSPAELARVRSRVADHLGPDVAFEVVLVSEIPIDATGKFRVSRSLVGSPYDKMGWAAPP